ncbi:glycosyltransferase family 92 protein C33H5.2-like [Haliotis rubra]|uniref:glycosyltransferase family 92 protein C33H5.2-like n=1 Tax=Haliotis rubra TaxID=36100 RepID=UPI001EE58D9B|nr:glycosyltransferase family 92 protein C33H5.2-like [Haliotis rubra]
MICLRSLRRRLPQMKNIFKKKILFLLLCAVGCLVYVWMTEDQVSFGPVLNHKWTLVSGSADLYVFSAYFTGRDHLVRIVSVGPTLSKGRVVCSYYFLNDVTDKVEAGEEDVSGTIHQMRDHHGMTFNTLEITCPLKKGSYPHFIGLSATGKPSNYLKINYPPTRSFKAKFTVCIPPIHSNFSHTTEVVQTLEFDQMLGASDFTIYYTSASPEVDAVLRMYRDVGVVKVVPWFIPDVDVHYHGQIASVRDCFYRNMHTSDYIVFKDLDEILLPYKHRTWQQLLDNILERHSRAGAFIFRNSFIHKLGPDVTDSMKSADIQIAKTFGLYTLLKRQRQTEIWKYNLRAKFIVNPLRVHNVEIHEVKDIMEGYTREVVDEPLGLLFHYKQFTDAKIKTVNDPAAARYREELINRVKNTYHVLNTQY